MTWPRVRFTVRRLMIAVAILALAIRGGLWVVEMRARSASYERRAYEFASLTQRFSAGPSRPGKPWVSMYEDENHWRNDAWACKLAEKYWRLSDFPWLTVEPDPLPPEPLAKPRHAYDLPPEMQCKCRIRPTPPPAWTFPWTWRRQ